MCKRSIDNGYHNSHVHIIMITNGNNCIIDNNTLINNGPCAISVDGANHTIINNTINRCGAGIAGSFSNVTIVSNVINNTARGMQIYAQYSLIKRNKISNASEAGIRLEQSNYNIISLNTFENNGYNTIKTGWGLWIKEEGFSTTVTHNLISQNNFINNSLHVGCYYYFFGRNKYEKNYWDDWTGFGPKSIYGRNVIFIIPILFFGLFVGKIDISIPWIQFDWRPAQEPYDIGV